MATLSDRIKNLRLSENMTQEEFGKKFGIVKSTVSLYENGKSTPNDQLKKQICNYFHVSAGYLLGIDDETNQEETFSANESERNLLEIYRSYKDTGFSDTVLNELKSFFPELNVNPIKSISERERTVLDVFRKLNEDNQDIIVGDMKKYLKEQRYEESVAADKQLKNLK